VRSELQGEKVVRGREQKPLSGGGTGEGREGRKVPDGSCPGIGSGPRGEGEALRSMNGHQGSPGSKGRKVGSKGFGEGGSGETCCAPEKKYS